MTNIKTLFKNQKTIVVQITHIFHDISYYCREQKKTGRQNHDLTQWKMLCCKTVLNIITYHHVV
jgi:hypothetical protein